MINKPTMSLAPQLNRNLRLGLALGITTTVFAAAALGARSAEVSPKLPASQTQASATQTITVDAARPGAKFLHAGSGLLHPHNRFGGAGPGTVPPPSVDADYFAPLKLRYVRSAEVLENGFTNPYGLKTHPARL
jgi:hypothetical protein